MLKNNPTGCQERLEDFLQAVESAQKLQNDIIKYGLEAAHFYVEDLDGDWLEKWSEDEEEQNITEHITNFLESGDPVAVKLWERIGDKPLTKIVSELERCLSFSKRAEQIFAIKDFLLHNSKAGRNNSTANDGYDLVNLVNLAEELLEKLTDILD
ncbi:hypothetical protein [Mastigocoleus testarum]|uniref:Uncharacterized protein n=1 Tax=Mastigocoleus testarum BC008 TaxID=371196 RepID=A0A0V7ZLD1_9CYAN|nr:hypothetical protein [Mastigocoleus testarum]KST65304.1 hypothetical protein BC008_21125 [Mastigocoleus testarum BC008]KST65642.1 hypothetical protein BC008_21960 [Mastigocoleus testarum BC008]